MQSKPPQLIVSVVEQEPRTYNLIKERLTIGRTPDNDIVIASPIVSGSHCTLERNSQGYILKINPGASNPVYHLGKPLQVIML